MKFPISLAGAAVALALTLAFPAPGQAGPTDRRDLEEKVRTLEAKQEESAKALEVLKAALEAAAPSATHADFTQKLEALEKQQAETKAALEALRAETARRAPGPIEPKGLTPKSFPLFGSSGPVTSGTAFNPSISVIPDVVYYRDSVKGEAGEILEEADGFHGSSGGDEGGHGHGGMSQGFNLRETEIAFSASVDSYFDVVALFAASEEGFEAEEVFFQTRRLPGGFQLKGGKFLSGIGYANEHHPHRWDFVDQNLAYELLLGGRGLNEKGLQVNWLPKLPFYLRAGVELLQGENEKMSNYIGPEEFPGTTEEDEPRTLSESSGPRLYTGFLKVGPNLGYSSALQLGLSYATSRTHQEVHDDDGNPEGVLDGTGELWGVDLVFKYDSPRPYGAGDFVFQAEYLHRKKDLDLVGTSSKSVSRQDGATFQAVYGLLPRVQLAARYDLAGLTNEDVHAGVKTEYETSKRWTGAITFNPTEFSRVRAQYNRGEVFVGGERETYGQFFLQVQLSIGAHGAHKF